MAGPGMTGWIDLKLCIDWYHVKAGPVNPKQRSRGRGNNGGNPNRGNYSSGGHGGHGGGGGGGGGQRHINVRTQVFDSNGPEGRIRGNAHQVMEKYLALARDASSQGDRVAAENFYQHAEHYFRLINAYNQNNGQRRPQNLPTPAEDQNDMTGDDGEGEDQAIEQSADDAAEQPAVEVAPEAEQPRPERGERPPRTPRGERQPRRDREDRRDRDDRPEQRAERPAAPDEAAEQPAPAAAPEAEQPRPERAPRRRSPRQAAQPAAEQPDEGTPSEAIGA